MHRKVRDLHTDNETCLVAMRPGETPVPFPNTMVKTRAADDTVPETVRESRWLPDSKKNRRGGNVRASFIQKTGFTSDQRFRKTGIPDG